MIKDDFNDAWEAAWQGVTDPKVMENEIKNNKHAQVSGVTKMSRAEQKELADRFCEGSAEYRELLLTLWAHGIETRGGCSGITKEHDLGGNRPYFAVTVTDGNREFLENLVAKLKETPEYKAGGLEIWGAKNKSFGDSIAFYKTVTKKDSDDFFAVFRRFL